MANVDDLMWYDSPVTLEEDEIDELHEKIAALENAIVGFGDHQDDCRARKRKKKCDCGWDETVRDLRKHDVIIAKQR